MARKVWHVLVVVWAIRRALHCIVLAERRSRVFLRHRAAFACIAIAAVLSACGGDAGQSIPAQNVKQAESQHLSSRALRFSGTAASVELGPNGAVQMDLGGPGHLIESELVSGRMTQFRVHFDRRPSRKVMSIVGQPDGCPDGCVDYTNSTPSPAPGAPSPPPNYGQCANQGGATWYNNLTGSYGCVKGGGQQQLSCGVLTLYSPGHGRLTFNDGSSLVNIDFVIDHGESGCTLG
jgi:hypothetical protein